MRLLLVQNEELRLVCVWRNKHGYKKYENQMVIMISFVPGRWMRFETSEWSELKVPCSFVLTLLVSGPRFAIESLPRRSCLLSGWNLYVNTNKRLRMQSWPVERTIERIVHQIKHFVLTRLERLHRHPRLMIFSQWHGPCPHPGSWIHECFDEISSCHIYQQQLGRESWKLSAGTCRKRSRISNHLPLYGLWPTWLRYRLLIMIAEAF